MTRFALFAASAAVIATSAAARPNFLFIAIDDLNDFCGYAAEEPGNFLQAIYPDPSARSAVCERLTPNLDRLAARSATFRRAYCPSPLCGPSRTSLMTGVLPVHSGYYMHSRHFRLHDTLRDAVTLPQQLKASGYQTVGLGKLFHKRQGTVDGPLKDDWADARFSWSTWVNHPGGCNGGKPSRYSPRKGGLMQFGPSSLTLKQSGDWRAADFAARLLEHGQAATSLPREARARRSEQTAAFDGEKPFFLGCGIFRPHLPFFAPQAYFDRFPMEEMEGLTEAALDAIVADLDDLPPGARRFSDYGRGKLRSIMKHAKSLGESGAEVAAWRALVQSYLACVAFADDCVGRLVEGYDRSPHRDNTVLILWSDHGYHLGSKYHVAKQALWEEANRVQLIIHDPRNPASCDGRARRQIVSLNDLFPTICELAGAPLPETFRAGASLQPLLDNAGAEEIHDQVVMTYQQGNHALRTPNHRFMRYRDGSTELYDMLEDPAQHVNLAGGSDTSEFARDLLERLESAVEGEVVTR